MREPDPDAVLVAAVLAASDQPMTTELLLSAAKAFAALRSSRERVRYPDWVPAPTGWSGACGPHCIDGYCCERPDGGETNE